MHGAAERGVHVGRVAAPGVLGPGGRLHREHLAGQRPVHELVLPRQDWARHGLLLEAEPARRDRLGGGARRLHGVRASGAGLELALVPRLGRRLHHLVRPGDVVSRPRWG